MKSLEVLYGKYTDKSRGRARAVAIDEAFQLSLLKTIRTLLPQVTAFVDVGANVGVYAIAAAKAGFSTVIAVEPSPDTFIELTENIKLNSKTLGFSAIEPVNVAISNKNDLIGFMQKSPLGTGNRLSDDKNNQQCMVRTLRLDDLVSPDGARDLFVKIDVEGHEVSVLEGAVGCLENRIALMQIEILAKFPENREKIIAQMAAMNYECLFRVGGDYLFLHSSHSQAGAMLKEQFYSYSIEMARFLRYLAKKRLADSLQLDSVNRKRFRSLFNGFRGVLSVETKPPGDGE